MEFNTVKRSVEVEVKNVLKKIVIYPNGNKISAAIEKQTTIGGIAQGGEVDLSLPANAKGKAHRMNEQSTIIISGDDFESLKKSLAPLFKMIMSKANE